MKAIYVLAVSGFLLSSCETVSRGGMNVPVDLRFAKTDFGYVNSGGYKPGSLFLWNREEGALVALETVDGFTLPDSSANGTDVVAKIDGGAKFGVGIDGNIAAKLDAELKTHTSLTITDARRDQNKGNITKLSNFLAQNIDRMDDWSFRDVQADKNLYYILISDVTTGDKVEISVNNTGKSSLKIPVKIGEVGYTLDLNNENLISVTGDNVVTMFNVMVLDAQFVDNGENGKNPSFKIVHGLDLGELPELLRGTGKRS